MGGGFRKQKVLLHVGGAIRLVNHFINEVYRVETEVNVSIFDIIWVLLEQIHLSLNFSALKKVKKAFVLWFVLFVQLEHLEDLVAFFDVF